MQENEWNQITPQLHLRRRIDGKIELSDVSRPDPIEEFSIEIFDQELDPLIESLRSLLPKSKEDQVTPCVLYVDPQQDHILVAIVIKGKVHSISRVDDFDDVHQFAAACVRQDYVIERVRIDTGFRTAESRDQALRYNWIEDRSFDVRKMKVGEMVNTHEPVKAAGYKPTHGGFVETYASHTCGAEATHDFLRVGPSSGQRGENLFE